MDQGSLIVYSSLAVALLGGALGYIRRGRRQRRDAEVFEQKVAKKQHLARSLHLLVRHVPHLEHERGGVRGPRGP